MGEQEEFSLRRIAVPAFGPSAIWSIGAGAVLPVVALSARGLGASVGLAALFVGIATLSEFAAAVPAGVLVERIGERRALVAAGGLDAAACALALVAPSLWVLGVAVFLMGPTGAVFLLARQSYLTAAAPVALRARAMSTLGGVTRIGLFVGPLIGAPVVARWGPQAAFAVAVVAGLLAAALAWRTPDLGAHHERLSAEHERVPVARVVAQNRRVLLTVGLGVLAIGLARSSRVVVVPLWAEHVGLDAAQTSLVFAAAAFVEVVLFYPAGTVMDRHGRVWVAVPVTLLLGLGPGRPAADDHARRRRGARAAHGRRQRPGLRHRHDPGRGCRPHRRARALPRRVAAALPRRPQRRRPGRRCRRRGRDDRGRQRGGGPADPRRRRLAGPLAARVRPPPPPLGTARRGVTRRMVGGPHPACRRVNVGLPT